MVDHTASARLSAASPALLMGAFILAWFSSLLYTSGSVIVDGFQSLGAISDSRFPGSLHWPMLGSFMGYDETWGFHWIGWPMLRSLLLPILVWHPLTEILLICLVWGVAGWQIMRISQGNGDSSTGRWVGVLTLVSPGFLVAAQSYRPEIPTALLLVLAIRFWRANHKKTVFARCMVLIALPMIHPMGLILPVAWCGWDFLLDQRRDGFRMAFKKLLASAWPLGVGVILASAWFGLQANAWEQFQWNIKSQRMLIQGMGTGWGTFFRWGFGSPSSLPLIVLLLGALLAALHVLWRQWGHAIATTASAPITYASVGLVVALVFNIMAKNPNSLHLVAVLPMAVWLFSSLLHRLAAIVAKNQWLLRAAYIITLLVFLAYPLKLTGFMIHNRGRSYRGALAEALANLPQSRKVLIPVAFWEAAQLSRGKTDTVYQFSTFPNILLREKRECYEKQATSEMQAGDLLLWDPLQESGGIFNFVEETALRHIQIQPQENSMWERMNDVNIPISYSRNQATLFQVYRLR